MQNHIEKFERNLSKRLEKTGEIRSNFKRLLLAGNGRFCPLFMEFIINGMNKRNNYD